MAYSATYTQRLQGLVDQATADYVREIARSRRVSVSTVVREMVEDGVQQDRLLTRELEQSMLPADGGKE